MSDLLKYSSVVVELPDTLSSNLLKDSHNRFKPEDLVSTFPIPHVTITYGLVTTDIQEIAATIGPFPPLGIAIGKMGVFIADSQRDSDVVKLDVGVAAGIETIREKLLALEQITTYKNFYPHITLAYVLPTFGLQYVSNHPMYGCRLHMSSVVIKNTKGETARLFANGDLYEI